MKKTLLSLAVLAAAANVAHAQSNVTIYGVADAGLVSERGGKAGSVTKLTSGIGSASRLGFRGTEEVSPDLSALFVLESGVRIDSGEVDAAGTLFNRQSYVGLKSKSLGGLTLGRQYTPLYNALSQVADPFGAGYAGSAKNLFPAAGNNTRTSNTIVYASPVIEGVSGELAYSLGEQSSNKAGRQIGAALAYANGPLNARLAYNLRNNDTPTLNTDLGHNVLLAANYDFKVAKAFFAYGKDKGVNSAALPLINPFSGVALKSSTDSTDLLLGATAPLGAAGTVIASVIRKDDKQFNQDATQWAIGYSHALSKRTSAYVAYAKIQNKNGAGYTVGNNSEAGSGDKAFDLGIRHAF